MDVIDLKHPWDVRKIHFVEQPFSLVGIKRHLFSCFNMQFDIVYDDYRLVKMDKNPFATPDTRTENKVFLHRMYATNNTSLAGYLFVKLDILKRNIIEIRLFSKAHQDLLEAYVERMRNGT